jgi:DNA-binding winged helix-turn-helix (wHTH) protein/tetratricopeptide (TPR) repeat protein
MKEFPPFKLDTLNECLWRRTDSPAEDRLPLTPKAYAVLNYLVERPGRLVTRRELIEAVWPDVVVQPEVLKSQILEVRRVLGDDAKHPQFIETLHRRGYRFIAPVRGYTIAEAEVSAQTSLVARDQTLHTLRNHLRTAMRGLRQIILVTGEPGIGKTTLVDEFQRQATNAVSSIRTARGQCIEGYGGREPFYPILEALSQLLRGPFRNELVRILESQAPTWLVQFPALLTRRHRETLQREILGATRERMLREISVALESIAANTPLLLILEDLQWVDHSSVDLVCALARRRESSNLMILATHRVDISPDHPLRAITRELVTHQLCREIDLQPFTQLEVAEYLAAASPRSQLPEGLAEVVHRHTEGNPLFIVASLEHLTRRGLISRENGIWQVRVPLAEIDLGVPETLRQMIEAQIERLSAEEQRALEAASVLGASFEPTAGAAAASMNIDDFENVCESLARKRHILRAARDPNARDSFQYQFAHALYREVFYKRQPPTRRTRIHLRCGDWLESRDAANGTDAAPILAHHFEQSGSWERAVKYLRISAETATRRLAYREAAAILRHALGVANKLPSPQGHQIHIDVLRSLCAILEADLDDRSIEFFELLAEKSAQYGLIEEHVRTLNDMAGVVARFDNERCIQILNRAIEIAPKISDPVLRTRELATSHINRIVLQGWSKQDATECRGWIEQVRPHISSRELAPLLLQSSWVLVHLSRYREALAAAEEALATFDADFRGQRNTLGYLAKQLALEFLGEWGRSLQWSQEIAAVLSKTGYPARAASIMLIRARICIHADDCASARPFLESVLPLFLETKLVPLIRSCRAWIALTNVSLGDVKQAMDSLVLLEEDVSRLPLPADNTFRPTLEWGFVEAFLAGGDTTMADLHHLRWVAAAERIGEVTWQGLAWEGGARIALAMSDADEAKRRLASAFSAIEGYEAPLASWKIHASAAEVEELLGDPAAAHNHRRMSAATVLALAQSLPETDPTRQMFLTSPRVKRVLQAL